MAKNRKLELQKPEVKAEIIRAITNAYNASQHTIEGIVEKPDIPAVVERAKAAVAWCERATAHEESVDGKPWWYLLIPHDVVTASATLKALAERFSRTAVTA